MVKQFEVYRLDLKPTKGSEINEKRPCVLLSPKKMNNSLNTVIIAPLTSTIRNYPSSVSVTVNNKKGQVALDQLKFIDKARLCNRMEVLNRQVVMQPKRCCLKCSSKKNQGKPLGIKHKG